MEYAEPDILFKMVFLGNVGVGKTSIFKRLALKVFDDELHTEIDHKKIPYKVGGTPLKIVFHDTAGQERFRTLTSSYFRNADAVLIVYDVTDKQTYDDLESIYYEGSRYCSRALKFLIGNKLDLEVERTVTTEEGQETAKSLGASGFFETSAKTNQNMDALLAAIATQLLEGRAERLMSEEEEQPPTEIVDLRESRDRERDKKGGCCG